MKKRMPPDQSKPISLSPLTFDEALKALLGSTASKKPVTPKRSKSKSASKSAS